MIIDDYLQKILAQKLVEYKLKYRFVLKICDDIRNRMISLLSVWDDEPKRNAILFLTLEEAPFYQPKSNPFVAEFVVATIRNSMFELAASDNCQRLKMSNPLSDVQIKAVTSSAIEYFNNCSFEELVKELPTDWINLYDNAIEQYPIAWQALLKLANMKERVLKIPNSIIDSTSQIVYVDQEKSKKFNVSFFDGYSLSFDPELSDILNKISSGEMKTLFVDCSKMLTRNFEKYLHVLEIVLQNNAVFCTCNYYISNTCLEKRKEFLRAAHGEREMYRNIRNCADATPNIREVIESFDI